MQRAQHAFEVHSFMWEEADNCLVATDYDQRVQQAADACY
jgi:hypothetical protein